MGTHHDHLAGWLGADRRRRPRHDRGAVRSGHSALSHVGTDGGAARGAHSHAAEGWERADRGRLSGGRLGVGGTVPRERRVIDRCWAWARAMNAPLLLWVCGAVAL